MHSFFFGLVSGIIVGLLIAGGTWRSLTDEATSPPALNWTAPMASAAAMARCLQRGDQPMFSVPLAGYYSMEVLSRGFFVDCAAIPGNREEAWRTRFAHELLPPQTLRPHEVDAWYRCIFAGREPVLGAWRSSGICEGGMGEELCACRAPREEP